jgi:glycosyltransferase involved in cell wall biosynthesis
MRVLTVTRESADDRRYGLGRSLAPVLAAMEAQGVSTRYFCAEDVSEDSLMRRRARVEQLSRSRFVAGRRNRIDLLRAWAERLQIGMLAADVARREGYTHVHAHDPWLAGGVAIALLRRGARGIRWGFTEHGFGSYSQATHEDGLEQGPAAQRWLRRIERFVAARAHWVTAPTQGALQQAARDLGLRALPAHWHHVSHARPSIAPPSDEQRGAARARFAWDAQDLVVLAVGRLVPLKCFDRIVRACAAQPTSRVRLQLLGGGDPAPYRALAGELGFADRLRVDSTTDVVPYYHAADIYMSASSTESFGLANLEALCAGLPAICSAAGGVPEVVGDGAWLVANDTDTLTRTLASLVAEAALQRAWRERALARAGSWPTAEQVARNYVAIYQAAS